MNREAAQITVAIAILCFLGGVFLAGIKHATTGDGTKVTDTVWSEDHENTGTDGVFFKWKDTPYQVLVLAPQTASVAWTDIASATMQTATSTSAKMAYCELWIVVTNAAKDYKISLRKNGTSTAIVPCLSVYGEEAHAADNFRAFVIVGLDSSQIMEYKVDVEAGGSAEFSVCVLGYWE